MFPYNSFATNTQIKVLLMAICIVSNLIDCAVIIIIISDVIGRVRRVLDQPLKSEVNVYIVLCRD
jgi:hypothetical protein